MLKNNERFEFIAFVPKSDTSIEKVDEIVKLLRNKKNNFLEDIILYDNEQLEEEAFNSFNGQVSINRKKVNYSHYTVIFSIYYIESIEIILTKEYDALLQIVILFIYMANVNTLYGGYNLYMTNFGDYESENNINFDKIPVFMTNDQNFYHTNTHIVHELNKDISIIINKNYL